MMHVIARGGLVAGLMPGLDHQDQHQLTLVAKGTWSISKGRLRPVDERQRIPLHPGPVHLGDPAASSLRWAGDAAPLGAGTDVVVLGEAVSPRPTTQLLASITVEGIKRELLLHGPRRWDRGLFGWKITPAEPASRFPLSWEHAVGGTDRKGRACPHNPLGRGWAAPEVGAVLPGIDDPAAPYTAPNDRPDPVNTGYVAANWQPRLGFAGTYDASWQQDRAPLLPGDFNPRFHRAACGPLALTSFLKPKDTIQLSGFTAAEHEGFYLPSRAPRGLLRLRGRDVPAPMRLSELAILPAEGLVVLTWKATVAAEATDCAIAWVLWDGAKP